MKIIVFNTTNNIGSTGKLAFNLYCYGIKNGHEMYVISGKQHDCSSESQICISNPFEHKIDVALGQITGLNGCYSNISTSRAIKIIKTIRPDALVFGNLHGSYINIFRLYRYARKEQIPCIQLMWDEYPLAGGCTYSFDCDYYKTHCHKCPQRREYPKSLFFDTSSYIQRRNFISYNYDKLAFIGVPYTIKRAKESFLLKNKVLFELDESVDQIGLYYPRNSECLREQLNIPADHLIVLNVCVFTNSRKGGKYYLDLAKSCIDNKQVTFIHIGYNGDKKVCPSNFIPIPFEKDQNKMAEYYSLADLFVCTSFADTQPNACLEALSCGTPICGFDVSGVPTCAAYPYGRFVTPGSVEELKEVVLTTEKKNERSIIQVRKYAESRFSAENYNERILRIVEGMINKENRYDTL